MEPVDLATLPPELAPEPPPKGPWVWARENLFATPANTVLSVVAIVIVTAALRGMIAWMFDTGRGWEAVATNMRLYMTQAYPESQFIRMWVSIGIIMALVGLSLALWKVGSQVTIDRFSKALQAAGGFLMLAALLGPPNRNFDNADLFDTFRTVALVLLAVAVVAGAALGVMYLFTKRRHDALQPYGVGLIGLAGVLFFLEFLIEAIWMTGGRIVVFLISGAVVVTALVVRKILGDRSKDITFHSLYLLAAAGVGVALFVSFWPLGRYTFQEGEVRFETGPVSDSTRWPIVRMIVVLAIAYAVGYLALKVLPEKFQKALQRVMLLGWGLALPVIILVVLRDPDWNPDREGGGFDFLQSTDLMILLAFGIGGSILIAILSDVRLGESGRFVAGLVLVGAFALWFIPMLMRIRLLALLLGLFAIGARSFAGDRRSKVRYIALWSGLVVLALYFLVAIDTESTLIVQGKTFLGGLTLTFVLALTSILLSFPIGVLMALGRTSTMPIFRMMSTVYIEMVRGIPFITVLIFFDLILVLFLPQEVEFDSVTLAILAGTLFSAAYLAENVRGGLQAIPKGQYEAAKAMGLSTLQLTVFIVLPQALRAVIPALVGQTIAIFKDTSLVAIIGLFDFLYIANNVIPNQTVFLGIRLENLLFIAGGYWIFTFAFSRASLRIEKKVGLGER